VVSYRFSSACIFLVGLISVGFSFSDAGSLSHLAPPAEERPTAVTDKSTTLTERFCGVSKDRRATKVFADPDGKSGWHRYQSTKSAPELELGFGKFAAFRPGSHGRTLIGLEEPGEDIYSYTAYCFERSGRLVYLGFELRTAWGWGFREEGPVRQGALVPEKSGFFDTQNDHAVPKPENAEDLSEALKPHLYLKTSDLPFFDLLRK